MNTIAPVIRFGGRVFRALTSGWKQIDIHEVGVEDLTHVISLFDDDMILMLSNSIEVTPRVLKELMDFTKVSGLSVNFGKLDLICYNFPPTCQLLLSKILCIPLINKGFRDLGVLVAKSSKNHSNAIIKVFGNAFYQIWNNWIVRCIHYSAVSMPLRLCSSPMSLILFMFSCWQYKTLCYKLWRKHGHIYL